MIIWTVTTPDMRKMAEMAASFLDPNGKHQAVFLNANSKSECHRQKIEAWFEFDQFSWYFDADYWKISSQPILIDGGDAIIGCPNTTPSLEKYPNLDTSHLICTGFWGMNPTVQENKRMLELALKEMPEIPLEDEGYINRAILKSNAVLTRLSTRWNWCGDNPPKDVVAIHAAGRQNKLEWLKKNTEFYERTYLDK